MDQVELHISASADLLPILLLLRVWHILTLVDNWQVRWQEALQASLDESKTVLLVVLRVVQVVKEDAANTSALVAVLVGEVPVAPLLETWVVGLVVLVAGNLDRLVEVDCVLVEEVRWSEIGSTAEPPGAYTSVWVLGLKVSVVEVNGWRHWVLWVQNHTKSCREERQGVHAGIDFLVIRTHLQNSLLWKCSVDDGDVNSGLLKDIAILQDAGDAAAAVLALPPVDLELLPVDFLECAHDLFLLVLDECFHAQAHWRVVCDARFALGEGIALSNRWRL